MPKQEGKSTKHMSSDKQKNIVVIMADQLGAAMLGCYGSGVDSTPFLDSLAAQGVLFDRCYATSPVCAPNRACMFTGRSVGVHGIHVNNFCLSNDLPTYAHVLRRKGYRTGIYGKIHQTPMQVEVPEDVGFLGFDEGIITDDIKWGPYQEYIKEHFSEEYEKVLATCWSYGNRDLPETEKELYRDSQKKYLLERKENSPYGQVYTSPVPAGLTDTAFIADCGISFIKRQKNSGKPFFCEISFVDPHDPYDPPQPYDDMFKPEDMKDPIAKEWSDEDFPTLKRSTRYIGFEKVRHDKEVIKLMRAHYHGSLKLLDDNIRRIVESIKENGTWDDTVIFFTTDHGDMMGDHGLIAKGAPHYDLSIRCPLIIAGGGVKQHLSNRLTCTLDFFPTICELAGADKKDIPPIEGKSFCGELYGASDSKTHSDIKVGFGHAQSLITDDGFRLTVYSSEDKCQMFDLHNDPTELHDLYYEDEYSTKRAELLERLVRKATEIERVKNYKTMPVIGNRRIDLNQRLDLSRLDDTDYEFESCPDFDIKTNPYLIKKELSGEKSV